MVHVGWQGVCGYRDEFGNATGAYYTIKKQAITKEEFEELLQFRKLKMLKTIKNCMVFFTTLAIITLTIGLLLLIPYFASK